MIKKENKVKIRHLHQHESKKYAAKKFFIAILILVLYIFYLVFKFGADGLVLGIITWSAFVLATPIPDAGLILDLPLRVFAGIKMIISELIVWLISILINIYFIFFHPEIYQKTGITKVFFEIMTNPWPDWIILVFSFIGTFISLYFGDELLDIIFLKDREKYFKHGKWYKAVVVVFLVILSVYLYKYFLELFGLHLDV